jgi:hypothetical protein
MFQAEHLLQAIAGIRVQPQAFHMIAILPTPINYVLLKLFLIY